MGLLDSLLGAAQQPAVQDFIKRYEQGAPWEGISHEEAVTRYQQVATQIPHDQYVAAAEEAFARLTPEQRMQFGKSLQARAQQQNVDVPGLTSADRTPQDPSSLATITSRLRQQSPGILSQLVGGAGGQDMNPVAKAAVAGIAAIAMKRMMGAPGGAP